MMMTSQITRLRQCLAVQVAHFNLAARTLRRAMPIVMGALVANHSLAQEAVSDARPGATTQLEEIIVTAQKQQQNMQRVPLSVAVLGQEEIQSAGIFGSLDYANRLANVSFNERSSGVGGRGNTENFVIRGVTGLNTTARYVDDTAVPAGLDLKTVDVARIEVLRGPQGTLYGASAMGGAIKIVTNEADVSSTSADVMSSVSTVDEGNENYRVSGTLNAPVLRDRAAVRLVGYYDYQSGVFDRYVTTANGYDIHRNVDSETNSGVTLKAKWVANSALTVTPRLTYQRTSADGAHYADYSPDNFKMYRAFNIAEPYDDTLKQAAVNVAYDGEAFSVISATSFSLWDTDEVEDMTEFLAAVFGLDPPLAAPIQRWQDFQDFQEEVRFVSANDSALSYQAGLWFARGSVHREYFMETPGVGDAIGVDTDLVYAEDTHLDTDEQAVFGELRYSFSQKMSGILGGRWHKSSIEVRRKQDGIFNGGPTSAPGKQDDDGIEPKVSLQYQATDEAMAYVTAAKGYRIGGVNYAVPTSQCEEDLAELGLTEAPKTFESDSLWNYEVGAKTSWLDRRVTLNGALFWIDWTDIQQVVLLDCGYPFTTNVGAARSRGGELELSARPTDDLTLALNVGYTDAVITEPGQGTGAEEGSRVQQVPRWTVNTSGEYSWHLSNGIGAYIRADYQYQGESFSTFDQTDPARIRSPFSIANIRVGITQDAWGIAVFADNVTNEHANYSDVISIGAEVPGRPRYATNRPRTLGVEVRYEFAP